MESNNIQRVQIRSVDKPEPAEWREEEPASNEKADDFYWNGKGWEKKTWWHKFVDFFRGIPSFWRPLR